MKIKKIFFGLTIFLIALFGSHLVAFPLGEWLEGQVVVISYDFYIGSFPGYLDGFILSYVFFSSLLFSLYSKKFKTGFYWALPVLILLLLSGSINPQLWFSLLLLAVGLGLAWLILAIKKRFALTK